MDLKKFLDYYHKNLAEETFFSTYKAKSLAALKSNLDYYATKSPQWRFFDFNPLVNFKMGENSRVSLNNLIPFNKKEKVATFVDDNFSPEYSTFTPQNNLNETLFFDRLNSIEYFYLLNNLSFETFYFFTFDSTETSILNFICQSKNFVSLKIGIIIPEGVKAKIKINYLNSQINSFTNISFDFFLKKNASLDLVNLNNQRINDIINSNYYFELEQNSELDAVNLIGTGITKRSFWECNLKGTRAKVNLKSLSEGQGTGKIYNYTVVNHQAAESESDQLHKAILLDQGSFDFYGNLEIGKKVKNALAKTVNRNLLLSKHAIIYTRPELKINHDEVKCSHGATIGKLDENALFYLMTRGISLEQAKTVLLTAFKNEILLKAVL